AAPGIMLCLVLTLGVASAQEAEPSCAAADIPQSAISARPLVEIREILSDPARRTDHCVVVAELSLLSRAGNRQASMLLGDVYSGGRVVPPGAGIAVVACLAAFDGGERRDPRRVGDRDRDGTAVPPDPER